MIQNGRRDTPLVGPAPPPRCNDDIAAANLAAVPLPCLTAVTTPERLSVTRSASQSCYVPWCAHPHPPHTLIRCEPERFRKRVAFETTSSDEAALWREVFKCVPAPLWWKGPFKKVSHSFVFCLFLFFLSWLGRDFSFVFFCHLPLILPCFLQFCQVLSGWWNIFREELIKVL